MGENFSERFLNMIMYPSVYALNCSNKVVEEFPLVDYDA